MKIGLPTQRVLGRALFSLQLVEVVTLSLSKGEGGSEPVLLLFWEACERGAVLGGEGLAPLRDT